jgi:hypothetical protein
MSETKPFIFQKYFIYCVILAVLLTAAGGCASPDAAHQIKSFSTATAQTIDNTTQAFNLVENTHFKMEVSEEVLHFDTNPGFNPGQIQPFMGTNALRIRLDVLNGLKSYAANLSALMGNGSLTNLDLDTTAFGSTLSTLNTNLVKDAFFKNEPVSAEELQIFTTAIEALGNWLIEYKQQEEAKKAIASMQQPVADICRLLQNDLEILRKQMLDDYKQTLQNENTYILNYLTQFNNNPGEKRSEINELAVLTQEINNEAALFSLMESTTAKMAAAHKNMGQVFSKNTTDISSLINEFSAESRRISNYYNSLKSTIK